MHPPAIERGFFTTTVSIPDSHNANLSFVLDSSALERAQLNPEYFRTMAEDLFNALASPS
jgi:hypothetical protein